jgi:hypothetical protein
MYSMYGYKSPMRPWITPDTWIPPKYPDFSLVSSLLEVICEHSYWSRLWIIQGIALSNNKFVVLPGYVISWLSLLSVLKWVLKSPENSLSRSQVSLARSKVFRQAMEKEALKIHFNHGLTAFPPGYTLPSQSMGTKMSSFLINKVVPAKASTIELDRLSTRFASASPIFYQIKDGLPTEGLQYLQILKQYKRSQCFDRRDKIYGLNSLTKIQPGAGIHVDYNENVYDLYFRICRLLLTDGSSLKESKLCFVGHGKPQSWTA